MFAIPNRKDGRVLQVCQECFLRLCGISFCKFFSLVTGEQDVRVLTLAEQIIAAMPDRIKVNTL